MTVLFNALCLQLASMETQDHLGFPTRSLDSLSLHIAFAEAKTIEFLDAFSRQFAAIARCALTVDR